MMRFLFLLALFTLIPSGLINAQDKTAEAWEIDRVGLNISEQYDFLGDNHWQDYSQSDAIEALSRFPDILAEAEYRPLVKALLSSESRPFEEDLGAPSLLSKRLNLLIRYGFIEDAKNLLAFAEDRYDITKDTGLSLVRLKLSLLEGELAPVCLDIQASAEQFRDMPSWRELVKFCRYRFESETSINYDDLNFRNYPHLKYILADTTSHTINYNDLEILAAYADNKLFDDQSYKTLAAETDTLRDLLILLASQKQFNHKDTHQCYVIEAVSRGLRDWQYLQESYGNVVFEDTILDNNSGQVTMHPCSVPAFFFQKIQAAETEINRRNFLNAIFAATESMPVAALLPFADFITNTQISENHHWRAAIISAQANGTIPDSLLPIAMPLKAILEKESLNESDYIEWANIESHENILEQSHIDIATPLYFLQIINGEINNLDNRYENNKYENIFPLTYEKKSLNLGLGFTGFMSALLDNRDPVAVLTRLMSLTAHNRIRDYSTKDAAVILSVLKAYKLEKEYVMLAFEYLQ